MSTIKEVLAKFKKELGNTLQAQKNIVDVTQKYIGMLENATSGGDSETYSNTEQIIGTWFGDNLYQKSYIFEPPFTAGNNNLTLNLDSNAMVISYEVFVIDNLTTPTCIGIGDEIKTINANESRIVVSIASGTVPYLSNGQIMVTVRYTKTT